MRTPQQFDTYLKSICGNGYHYYFQPPASIKLQYPAIIYTRTNVVTKFANNKGYKQCIEYKVTVVSSRPDEAMVGVLSSLPLSRYASHYTSDNLHHDVYMMYY